MGDPAYWAGVATLPVLAISIVAVFLVARTVVRTLDDHGYTFEFIAKRDIPNQFVLRHDIWWENQHGPFFTGGWYREQPSGVYGVEPGLLITRWVGLGRKDGVAVAAYRKQVLSTVMSPAGEEADTAPV